MKLAQDNSPVEVGGAQSTPRVFHILANADSFRALSSSLYNDKKLAIIRELAANAWDSHVAAEKKDIPFEIHLPTVFEPYFSIKDYGVGLEEGEYPSEENNWIGKGILGLYCTYFASGDKGKSNDYIGAFGLGSKSPFCYKEGKNGFTVVSRFNGRKKVYSAYLDKGLPYIVRQTDDPTDECNGLEVSFPTDKNDCYEFSNKAESALEFFNPIPKINVEIDIKKQEYEVKSERWGLRKNNGYGNGKLRAIQGMVPYTVGILDESLLTESQKKVVDLPIDIFFEIGEISPAVSREAVSNDDITIKNILAALDLVVTDFVTTFKEKLKVCKTEWEARLLIFSMINTPGLGGLINDAYNRGDFDGIYTNFTLKHTPYVVNELDYTATTLFKFKKNWRGDTAYKDRVFHLSTDDERKAAFEKIILKQRSRDDYERNIEVSDEVVFVINDVGFGVEKYVHHFLQNASDNQKIKVVYLITRSHKDYGITKVLVDSKKILAGIGNPPTMLVSKMKEKYQESTKTSTSIPYVKKEVFYFSTTANVRRYRDGYEASGWRDGWEFIDKDEVDYQSPRFYVELERLVPTTGKFEWAEDFKKLIVNSQNSKVLEVGKNDVVYGLPKGSPLLRKTGWIEFTDYVFQQLKKVMTPTKELELSLLIQPFKFESTILEGVYKEICKDGILDQDSPIKVFCKTFESMQKVDKPSLEALMWIVERAKERKLYQPKNIIDLGKQWQEVLNEYPMLRLVVSSYYSGKGKQKDIIINYIQLMDEQRTKKEEQEVVTLAIAVASEKEKQDVINAVN